MTVRQRLLLVLYPLIRALASVTGKNKHYRTSTIPPNTSFYSLRATLINGEEFEFRLLRGKQILIVNTASDCGFTAQYRSLKKLSIKCKDLQILLFPSDDFKNQEPGSDKEIALFCKSNFDLDLPLFKKSIVTSKPGCNEVFYWLTHKEMNGWNDDPPDWNFSKYLIDEHGRLTHVFSHFTDPCQRIFTEHLSCFS